MENYENLYDVIIIGGGAAGLTAGIYSARAKYKTLILEKEEFGGQIAFTEEVLNYPGILKVSGRKLTSDMLRQAINFGAEAKKEEVISVELNEDFKKVRTKNGEYNALSVIIATGAKPRVLGFKGEQEFKGRGIAYCATCDGEFFQGKDIFVIGGGLAAAEESMYLTKFAKSVTLLAREEELVCPVAIREELEKHEPKVDIIRNVVVEEVAGENYPNSITYVNTKTNEKTTKKIDNDFFGVFIFSGYIPDTKIFENQVELERGYANFDGTLETNIPGVYVAGDLRVKKLRQVITACSDGAIASINSQDHIEAMHKKYSIPRLVVENTEKSIVINEESKNEQSYTKGYEYIDEDMKNQLESLFAKLEKEIVIVRNVKDDETSREIQKLTDEVASISDKIRVENTTKENKPYIMIKQEGKEGRYKFYGVPGGHEFTSFILAIYYLSNGIEVDEDTKKKVLDIQNKNIDVAVTLSCTKCPSLVTELMKLLSLNENISVNIYELSKNEDIKEKYSIMSVPAMIIDEKIHFGTKTIDEILEILNV